MAPLTIMDSLARERERAAREGQRIVDAKKADFVTRQRGLLLPNLGIRRPTRSTPSSSPRSGLGSEQRFKASSFKNAQAWLNRAKAKAEMQTNTLSSDYDTGTSGALPGSGVPGNRSGGMNGAGLGGGSGGNPASGKPSTLADFVSVNRSGASLSVSAPMSLNASISSNSGIDMGVNSSWGNTKLPPSSSSSTYPTAPATSHPFSGANFNQHIPQPQASSTGSASERDGDVDIDTDAGLDSGAAGTASGQRKRPRFSRSTAGCLLCRKQKVKCDETKPSCFKCIAAERECVWPPEGGRKRRKRGTVAAAAEGGSGKGESYALARARALSEARARQGERENGENADGADGRNKGHEPGKRERSESHTGFASGSGTGVAAGTGSGQSGIRTQAKTSMARRQSGLGEGSSGSAGSSEEDEDEDAEDEEHEQEQLAGDKVDQIPHHSHNDRFQNADRSNAYAASSAASHAHQHQNPQPRPQDAPMSSFDLSSTDWDFTNHLLSLHSDPASSAGNEGNDGGLQAVLNMGLNGGPNTGTGASHGNGNGSGGGHGSGGGGAVTGSSYLRGHQTNSHQGTGAVAGVRSGAEEVLGSHSMPTPSMPTPSSVHSASGTGMGMSGGGSGGGGMGFGMGGGPQSQGQAQSHMTFMNDSPTFPSPTASTHKSSLVHPHNIGGANVDTASGVGPGSGGGGGGGGGFDFSNASMSAMRQGTVSPSQLLLPRGSAGGGAPGSSHIGNSGAGLGMNAAASGPNSAGFASTGNATAGAMTMTAPATALSPPQLIDLSKSTLLAKRKDKAKFGSSSNVSMDAGAGGAGGQMMDVSPAQLRMAMVEMILQAFSFDEGLFEFGPSHRTRNLLNTLTTPINTDFLSLAFPSPAARLLFHHYCNVTSRLLITMGNVGPNPLLALCTPLKLLDTASAWAGAIRMSILSISATHFAHETEGSVGKEMLGEGWEGKRVRLKELSRKFKKAALCNVYLGTGGDDPQQIDSILAACTLLCIRDVIDADETWQDNLEFALHMISKRGGPLAMLKASDTSFTRRYLLENLAVHDVFGCFITGKEPALLGNYDPWWFDSVDSSTTRWEWESVEQTFGISRTVVDLLARIAALDSRKRRLEINLARNPEEMNDVGQYIYRECQNLLFELDILGNSLSALPQHVRVTCGDYIYKYTAAVYVLADILEEPPSTPRIIRDVASILELCSEASAMRMSVMLIWPLLIAGTFCLPDIRPKVDELFDVFEPYYAEDLPAARLLLREQWRGMDEGKGKRSWREVMKAANKFVLLI